MNLTWAVFWQDRLGTGLADNSVSTPPPTPNSTGRCSPLRFPTPASTSVSGTWVGDPHFYKCKYLGGLRVSQSGGPSCTAGDEGFEGGAGRME